MTRRGWQVWVDTGGTFTDCLAVSPSGETLRAKVLSTSALRGVVEERIAPDRLRVRARWGTSVDLVRGFAFRRLGDDHGETRVAGYDPESGVLALAEPLPGPISPGSAFEVRSPEEAPVLAARLVTGTPSGADLPPIEMRVATTRGTNALLTRSGAPTALFITAGFGDLLLIGTQQRPDLFARRIEKPAPLYAEVVEVEERVAADGAVLRPMQVEDLIPAVERLRAQGITAAAVALLHSDRFPDHERALTDFLGRAGFRHVSRSSALAPFIKLLPRAGTAVADAYLAPVIESYVGGVRAALPDSHALHVMTSAGGLVRPGSFHAKDSLLSGPAGGIVGAARAGWRSGFGRIIAFDMGGTSTDVARWDGDFEYVFEHAVGDAHLVAPALAIESVAAGGGSICAFDRQGLRVGPDSAGAQPGPACYGAGGPLTLTDVNLLLGRLAPDRFEIPIAPERAEQAASALLAAVEGATGERITREALLEGLLEIANERMADAIRGVSLRRGYDPSEYALVAFGGAGGQHACAVAARLGISTVLAPPDAGLLSARGIGHAVIERFAERQTLCVLDESAEAEIVEWLDALAAEAKEAVAAEGVPAGDIVIRRRIANLRFLGQDTVLSVEYDQRAPLALLFANRYESVFGYRPEGRAIEIESLRVVASSRPDADADVAAVPAPVDTPPDRRVRACFEGRWLDAPAWEREQLAPGSRLSGPALVFERHSATVIEPGWTAEVDGEGGLVMRRAPSPPNPLSHTVGEGEEEGLSAEREATPVADSPSPTAWERGLGGEGKPEAVQLELFVNRFRTIAAEMGEQLRQNSVSTNVKERLDFSCGLLDARGELVVNAPHIPVHLGALGLCVRRLRETIVMDPGDVVVTNHPAFGGSHLPDVTVVTPVHDDGGALLGYVASRAHHAEIGGARPGSMPPDATVLAEEGVLIPPTYLVQSGEARWEELRARLSEGPYPSRAVEDNLADLRAAVAANRRGAADLAQLAREHGADTVRRYMDALQGRAERLLREALARFPAGRHAAVERLDDGSPLCVAVEIAGDAAVVDFAGTAPVHRGNLNATPAIVGSAVLYVLRLLVSEPLPLNEGLLRAVTLRIPENSLLNPDFLAGDGRPDDPARCPAVVGGNVETSQRLVDTLLGALGIAACSQGTMNNVLWGTEAFGYYETVCGGTGAGPDHAGADAVHSHMTNTRITDPEIVERRYPVRIERFAVRRGSGGAGRHRGGDGAIREYVFLAPMALSLLTQHRVESPYGWDGGAPGARGRQRLVRASGEEIELASIAGCEVEPGARLLLETPGGGGWGAPEK